MVLVQIFLSYTSRYVCVNSLREETMLSPLTYIFRLKFSHKSIQWFLWWPFIVSTYLKILSICELNQFHHYPKKSGVSYVLHSHCTYKKHFGFFKSVGAPGPIVVKCLVSFYSCHTVYTEIKNHKIKTMYLLYRGLHLN